MVAHPVQWLAKLTAVPLGLNSNPGEDMDVCKCIVPSWHGGTLNSLRAASPLVRLVEGEIEWLATLTAVPLGLDSNSGEDMDNCKCKLPSWHGGTLNSRRVASPLVRLVEREERRETPDPPPGCSRSKLEWNRGKSYCHRNGAQGYGQR
ncbi:uncharacterized protein TNCV_298681 [Trichonephila clavipes]|nr:uncharacterized protein TNCV_298681 [Trichonephila clavipes]